MQMKDVLNIIITQEIHILSYVLKLNRNIFFYFSERNSKFFFHKNEIYEYSLKLIPLTSIHNFRRFVFDSKKKITQRFFCFINLFQEFVSVIELKYEITILIFNGEL
jgi:hypothetical protein